MSHKEIPRAGLLKAALAGKITNREGAKALDVTLRHFQRLKTRFLRDGPAGLAHKSRGRRSGRGLTKKLRAKVARLMKTTYAGFNDSHLTEKLREVEKIAIGRESVRRIRLSVGLAASRKRRPRQHRARRLREARMGALVQIDGSLHDWLEGRGPWMCLLGAVDDATGRLLALHFRPQEDLHGFATILMQLFTRYGLPLAIYGDGASTLVRNDRNWTLEEELQGAQNPTHIGQMLRDLAIAYIRAHSPQAKGRVENRWGTLQDRLIAEMRLRRIATLEEANAYLPTFLADFNHRFARPPRDAAAAWRPPPRNLPLLISCRYQRIVANDNTISLRASGNRTADGSPVLPARWIQIPPGPRRRSYAGCRVEVRELLDGRLVVHYNGTPIAVQPAPHPSFRLTPRDQPIRALRKPKQPSSGRKLTPPKPKPPAQRKPRIVRDPWHGKSPRELAEIDAFCRG